MLKWERQQKEIEQQRLCESGIFFEIDFGPSLAHPRTHKDRYLFLLLKQYFNPKTTDVRLVTNLTKATITVYQLGSEIVMFGDSFIC